MGHIKQFNDCIDPEIRAIVLDGLEQKIAPLLAARAVADRPARGWLRAVRDAIGLSQGEVAGKIGVRRQSYAQFEAAEDQGSISIGSLRRAASAMDCELVYFVVPRGPGDRSYADLAQVHNPAAMHLRATDHSMALKGKGPPDGSA